MSPDLHAMPRLRKRVWTAMGVAMTALGCAPAGPRASEASVEALREQVTAGPPLSTVISFLRSGDALGSRLILVHGTPGSGSGWADYLREPPPGLEVVALDRPGFGRSGPAGAMPGLADQAAAVIALLPSDGRRVVLLGHSLGGPVVARVAADLPQRISAVVLLSASLDPALEEIHPMQHVGAWPGMRALLPRVIRNANTELMALKPQLEALAADLPRVRARVLILHGTADELVPVANVPFMQARLTGAACVRTAILQGSNHFLPWNAQAEVRKAIAWAAEGAC